MANLARHASSLNISGSAWHVGLVILGLVAALLIVYSPAPYVGLAVMAIVLGVGVPVAARHFFGVKAAA